MEKEIGGYFGLEQFFGREYHQNAIAVNSGRNALLYILKVRKPRKLYIPRFLCDSISEMCRRVGMAYEEYSVGRDFLPIFDIPLGDEEYLYIVNYFGQLSNKHIEYMKARWSRVIIDNVQAFFQRPVPGVDTVYSCRKFFGVPDGGYVVCEGPEVVLEEDASRGRMTHILGRCEVSGSDFYREFQNNDELFYELPLMRMSLITRNILRGVDYDMVLQKRNTNYLQLHEALGDRNKLQLTMPEGPYCYPFCCANGMELKRKLAVKKIYVATLWPNVLSYEGTLEKEYAENILPLPCDQRYGDTDMLRVIELIKEHIG